MRLCAGAYGCGQIKPYMDFAPRASRCAAHNGKGVKADPACAACQALINGANRQPRCRPCDSKRTRKPVQVAAILSLAAQCPTGATQVITPTPPPLPTQKVRQPKEKGEAAIKRIPRFKFSGPPSQGPQLPQRQAAAGGKIYTPANPAEIMRMISALYTREEAIKGAEDAGSTVKAQIAAAKVKLASDPTAGRQKLVEMLEGDLDYADRRLAAVKAWRDYTSQRLRLFLDHALTSTPYQTKICKTCSNNTATVAQCQDCNGTGLTRDLKTNHYAIASVEKLKHLKKVLGVTELCAKIKAKTADADDAFATLLENNQAVVRKFRCERQTGMEQDDAEQGAMIGLLDAAVRFNPCKPECYQCSSCGAQAAIPQCAACAGKGEVGGGDCRDCAGWGIKPVKGGQPCVCGLPRMMVKTSTADYKTYAYKWSFRNSRARKETDKRAGASTLGEKAVHSLDAMVSEDGESQSESVVSSESHGALGAMGEAPVGGSSHLSLDLREQIAAIADPRQKAIVGYVLAGLSLGDIAEKMDVSRATVAKLRDEAYAGLRGKLSGYTEVVEVLCE